jgi:hypothetical protein
MSKSHGKSFAFVASVVGAALITEAASAQTAAPVPTPAANAPPAAVPVAKPQKKPQKKSQKKVTPSVVVVVTNSRSVAVRELDATPSGGTLPKTIVSNLAPGKKNYCDGRDRKVLCVQPAWRLRRWIEHRFDKVRFVQG